MQQHGRLLRHKTVALKAVHILELRTALNQVYQALRRASPTYTDPTITVGLTTAKAARTGVAQRRERRA